ncbi:hypothetical protein CYLTODRAFT_354093 [Cylindrobasidium torrendii FP15055 ss-10]|uniref:Uncharacterized protein n=1 Tax=Cylindrobasidium torrendii FP15055 ss-10 TaxID=1314674 RepID=A0A0D7B9U6_9AGAR|nr:hypothetical protein CYLTODRAFT_354093 [Cylindrobasidium torrendii FP15055 ss-10]
MPHKRAKRSVREQQAKERGSDLAPTKTNIEHEAIPKSVARVLNAASVRQDWQKKRKAEDTGESERKKKKTKVETPKIQPGESLQHFNKRIEQDMRHLVRTAVQSSQATTRKAKTDELEAKKTKNAKKRPARSPSPSPPPPPKPKHADRPKEFERLKTSAPKRLNDIAMAPPEIKAQKFTKGVTQMGKTSVLSMAQKVMMEQEREKAIERYRQLKASRSKDNEL